MKLLFIFGDQAVGKMTVGQELAKITDLSAEIVAKIIKERFSL